MKITQFRSGIFLFLWSAFFLNGTAFGQKPDENGWGGIWEKRMTIGQAALDDAFKIAEKGNVSEALSIIDRVIASNPNNWRAYFLKAAVLTIAKRHAEALQQIDISIHLARKSNASAALLAELYESRGRSCLDFGRFDEARRSMEAAVRLQPADPTTLNDLAWMLATSEDGRVRNGRRAISIALRACKLSDWSNAYALDTLAAAYAEAGQFSDAVKYQQWAMDRLDPDDRKLQLSGMEERLRLYQTGRPFRG
jgi:tetratricopeptide (TPR) repeat protein